MMKIPLLLRKKTQKHTIMSAGLVLESGHCRANSMAASVIRGQSNDSISSYVDVESLCKPSRFRETMYMLHQQELDSSIYNSVLQECLFKKALSESKLVHAHMIQTGFICDEISLGNKLLSMYAKYGSLADAHRVLDSMPERNDVSWTVMVTAYGRNGYCEEAMALFCQMQVTGIQPSRFTFASVLPACADLGSLERGKEVHGAIIRRGFESNVFVGNALVDLYGKCGCVEDARQVFDKIPEQDVVSSNSMIAVYAQNGFVREALNLFEEMPERNTVSWNAVIAGFAQNGLVVEALEMFRKMPEQNVVSWTAMIGACARHGYCEEALALFYEMQQTGVQPNQFTFASVLPMACLEQGKEIHTKITGNGFQSNVFVGNALVAMYAKCGSIENARLVFDQMPEIDVVSWNTMIAVYMQHGFVEKALKLFRNMPGQNVVTWNAMIAGYLQNGLVAEASKLFQEMPKRDVVSWNTIITGYAQNGYEDEALRVFLKMPERDIVSWNAMISAHAQNGHYLVALKLFGQVQLSGLKPNSETFTIVLSACASIADANQGKEIHGIIIKREFVFDVFVLSALVDMYAKCGCIETARILFNKIPERDVVSWTAMIVGYAMHGFGNEAIQLFEQMQHYGVYPDRITFIGVLSACCHAGLVDEGRDYFDCMSQYYHIVPTMEHYSCMVDLLGRAGYLDEAQNLINKMPIQADSSVWGSLLSACRIHMNVELGEYAAERLFELDPTSVSPYVLLSNLYAAAGKWDDIEKVRKLMKTKVVEKKPGCSWIVVGKKVHAFLVGDKSHPLRETIYAELERLSGQMKAAGYVPDMRFALNDVEEEQKEQILSHHSEKLAIALGLISTPSGTTIQVIKNLRVCGDCHTAAKFISKLVAREIVVRDTNRFHHFKNGHCSCMNYW